MYTSNQRSSSLRQTTLQKVMQLLDKVTFPLMVSTPAPKDVSISISQFEIITFVEVY